MFQSSMFSICPEFRKKGRKLVVSSSWKSRWLTFGSQNRVVTINPDRKVITVRDRRLWVDQPIERYPFDLITAVSFHYWHVINQSTLTTRDRVESYAVGLKLYGTGDTNVHLFSYFGEGKMTGREMTPWLDWYRTLYDFVGTQEEEAQSFIKVLGTVLNKPIERL